MNTNFTYGGKRKSGLTAPSLFGGGIASAAMNVFSSSAPSRAYSETAAYESYPVAGKLPVSPDQATALALLDDTTAAAMQARVQSIKIAIASLTDFEAKTRAYYDGRVTQTSGDRRARLRAERAALCDQALAELVLLKSAYADASRALTSLATASKSDYNPNTGAILTPEEKAAKDANTSQGSDLTSMIIPVGAALAALFFLKGH